MSIRTRPDYGVDGVRYVVGLLSIAVLGPLVGGAALWLGPGTRMFHWGGGVSVIVGALALIPGLLGLRYVTVGKFRLRDLLLDKVQWRGDERTLDVGTGGGLMVIGAAKRAPRGVATGVDIWNSRDLSGNSRERALHNATLEGVTAQVKIDDGDARKLSYADDSFDVVVSVLCLHNIEPASDREAALREIARLVRPGGTVVLSDLAGVEEYSRVLTSLGFAVEVSGAMLDTFPPQRMVSAKKPSK